ncbi:regulatory factor sgt1 protein [Rutstroemia sp. NJR-2017a WRK4]|nr:regulatory factor sgt1 protein [Rutstroemia sp. NJR-2017a WRK4]
MTDIGGLENDFEGFGDNFSGFPKRLPEDTVEYSLYIIDRESKSQKDIHSRLEDVRKESLKLTKDLLTDYIWQRDGFRLEMKTEKGMTSARVRKVPTADVATGSMYLHGLTNYGDSVEDEWLIVYILKELSSRFPNLWIKVVDTDGEFLLIEAANALPRWLNPEIADNRDSDDSQVWIHNNALHIIPLGAVTDSSTKPTGPVSRPLTLEEAHKTITSSPKTLIHSPLIEEEAFYRLRNYPAQISASLHHACITIPRKLAYILHARPAAIAPAVEAFYLRDPIALKPLQMASAKLVFPPEDLVTVSVRFTKVLYAQLMSQQFPPPVAWKDLLANPKNGTNSKSYAQLEMGMKVTSGFEMLVTDPKNKDNRSVREVNILLEDLTSEGDSALPNDDEISRWKDRRRVVAGYQLRRFRKRTGWERQREETTKTFWGKSRQIEELDSDDEDDEEEFDAEGIQKVMKRIEAELKEAGALNLDPAPNKTSAAIKGKQPANEKSTPRDEAEGEDSDDEELDIDYNLAKNLLESFKSQGGMAGPGGNLLAMLVSFIFSSSSIFELDPPPPPLLVFTLFALSRSTDILILLALFNASFTVTSTFSRSASALVRFRRFSSSRRLLSGCGR